jgi:hypothetical protein
MRAVEFIFEGDEESSSNPIDQFADVLMVLGQIQAKIIEKGMSGEVPTDMVINYIKNAGIDGFGYDDLLKANEELPAMKELLKNITPETVTVVTGTTQTVDNPQDFGKQSAENPEQTVSNMAKSALNRRQP